VAECVLQCLRRAVSAHRLFQYVPLRFFQLMRRGSDLSEKLLYCAGPEYVYLFVQQYTRESGNEKIQDSTELIAKEVVSEGRKESQLKD
jgi:hypothetical protein